MRMPSRSRTISVWVEYLREENLSVDEAIERTNSDATASWLEANRYSIVSAKNVALFEARSSADIISTEEAEAVLSTPNEPDSEEQSPSEEEETVGPQRGTRV